MNLYNSYMTWTQSFQPFQYDLPADTFSGWKFDNSDAYVDDEVQLFGNYDNDVNQGGVYFSSDEYVLHDSMQKRSVSSHYEINGRGSETQRMVRTGDGFCFITGVRSITHHRDECMIATSNGYWTLTAQSEQSDFQCQASCVLGVGGIVSAHVFLHDRITNPVVRNLGHSTSDSVCFLTHVGRLSEHSQECEVNVFDGRTWSLRARSYDDWFRCAARCVRFPRGITHSRAVVESGTGSWTRSLGTSDTTFCYVSNVRNIHRSNEWCRVGNANRWRLDANSDQGTFRCGARCVSVPGAAYATVTLDWDYIMENNAEIEVHINEGLQLANSRTLTDSISTAFSVAVEANAIFAGTTVTGTITSQVSLAVGQIVTRSVSKTFVARCPQKSGYYVSLWQYKAVGELTSGGNDVAYTRQYRCQYHESARRVRPECPYSACGNLVTNPQCLRNGCDRWR